MEFQARNFFITLPYTRIIIYAVVYFILIDLDREFVNGILGP